MGEISKRLHQRLAAMSVASTARAPSRRRGRLFPDDPIDVQGLVKQGLDPVHAVYATVQRSSSLFSEHMSRFPELKAYAKLVGEAEEEYLPSAPPMSPLTTSYFTCWAFYDARFGPDDETLGECQIAVSDLIALGPQKLDALRVMSRSRMGVYEHIGMDNGLVRLRELITDIEYSCHSTSGYRGGKGELWYVRLLPPLRDSAGPHIVVTTPYILTQVTKQDWLEFLGRALASWAGDDESERLRRLLKFGPSPNYWNEFVAVGYHHHQYDAIFLAGIPDRKHTLPHA